MKEINELNLPSDLGYAESHEYAKKESDQVRIGIDDYAQDQLGEIVFVELPEAGAEFTKGEVFGSLESVKAVNDLVMPVGGEVIEINEALTDTPQTVNEDPYGDGWMILVKPSDPSEIDSLQSSEAILRKLKEEAS